MKREEEKEGNKEKEKEKKGEDGVKGDLYGGRRSIKKGKRETLGEVRGRKE